MLYGNIYPEPVRFFETKININIMSLFFRHTSMIKEDIYLQMWPFANLYFINAFSKQQGGRQTFIGAIWSNG